MQSALESAGTYSTFLSTFGNTFGLQKLDAAEDGDPWTVFAPTDAALAGAALTVNAHITTGQALTPAQLIAAGSFTSFTGVTHAVAGTVDALTVGGFPVSVIGQGATMERAALGRFV